MGASESTLIYNKEFADEKYICASKSTLIYNKEFADELKCLNCGELLTVLPIYFYTNRGNVCGRCPQVLDNDTYQNRALEEMIKIQRLSCPYYKNNCTNILNYKDVKEHEETCYYRQYSCPSIPLHCPWKGLRSEMKKHYEEKHKDSLIDKDKLLLLFLNKEYEQNILIETMKKQFLFHIRYNKNVFHCGLIYLEKPNEKKQYVITLLFKNREREYKQTIYNSRFLDTYLISNKELFEINFDKLNLLVNNCKSMNFQVTITEEEE